jgi:hypothetical protein
MLAVLFAKLKELAPYAVIVLLPGGSLVALMFWLLRRDRIVPVLADLLN